MYVIFLRFCKWFNSKSEFKSTQNIIKFTNVDEVSQHQSNRAIKLVYRRIKKLKQFTNC